MTDNFEESFEVNEDGNLQRFVTRIAAIPVNDINGLPIGKVEVAECATYKDIHFKVFDFLWDYHLEKKYTTDQISTYLKTLFPGYPGEAEDFIKSKLDKS
ncbi:MAG TPA: hypothetical protein DHV28_13690 [Ignavibacteriales bacterium]|nr:hypothetical protein [Ignavibacteriales bacterium]